MAKTFQASTLRHRGIAFLRRRRWPVLGLRSVINAIDVDGQVLRAVQAVHRYGRTRITRFAAERLDLPADANRSDPKIMGSAIAKAVAKLKWKPALNVMGVPRGLVILRNITLPQTDHPGELASMVHFQIAKDLPFPIEDAVVDFKVQRQYTPTPKTAHTEAAPHRKEEETSGDAKPRVEILVAAVKRDVVEYYREIAGTAGLQLNALGLRSYANARCVEACNLVTPDETVALVSLRPDEVIIDVLGERSLIFSRVASVAQPNEEDEGEHPDEPQVTSFEINESSLDSALVKPMRNVRFAEAVTIEVVRSLHSYQGTIPGNRVARVVVAGGTGNERDVVQALGNRLSIPASLLDPAAALGLPQSVSQHASGAMAVFGLGFGVHDPEGLPFNFLKPKRPSAPQSPTRVRRIATAAAIFVAILGLLGVRSHLVGKKADMKAALMAQLNQEKKNQPIYDKMKVHTREVLAWKKQGHNWLDYCVSLCTNLPPQKEVYLTSLNMNSQGSIRLSVLAKSGEILARLEEKLRGAGYTVKPLAITPGSDPHGYAFKSNVELLLPPPVKAAVTNNPAPPPNANGPPRTTAMNR